MLNTLVYGVSLHKGSQWALFMRTDVDTDVYEGARCVYASSD